MVLKVPHFLSPHDISVLIDFLLFGATLACVAIFHRHTFAAALTGLSVIIIKKLLGTGFVEGAGLSGLFAHFAHEWVLIANLFLLLIGFALLARHFEASRVPDWMPAALPDDWKVMVTGLAIGPWSLLRGGSQRAETDAAVAGPGRQGQDQPRAGDGLRDRQARQFRRALVALVQVEVDGRHRLAFGSTVEVEAQSAAVGVERREDGRPFARRRDRPPPASRESQPQRDAPPDSRAHAASFAASFVAGAGAAAVAPPSGVAAAPNVTLNVAHGPATVVRTPRTW